MNYFFEFLIILGVLLFFFYLTPAYIFHIIFHKSDRFEDVRIQKRRPTSKDIRREIKLSISTVFIFSCLTWLLLQNDKLGQNSVYYNFDEYHWAYMPVSFLLCLIVHDTYFYWTHRLMHLRGVFMYVHKAHHRSMTPSPWAILAFHPLEALVQFGVFAIIVLFVPINIYVFVFYAIYDSAVNAAGHNGFELVPKSVSSNAIMKFGNTVSHHDLHHLDFTKNYGAFFNIWDRLMGTFRDNLNEVKE